MAYVEQTVIDSIEVIQNGSIQIREATSVRKDGELLGAPAYRRWVKHPGDDVSDQDLKVQAIAAAIWTPEVVAAYRTSVEEQNPEG